MRSIWSSGMFSNALVPEVAEPIRMPSISTSVCALFAPRMNTALGWPAPPLLAISTPPNRCKSWINVSCPLAAMSPAVMTVTDCSVPDSGCGIRAAVTTTSGSATTGASAAWVTIGAHAFASANAAQPIRDETTTSLRDHRIGPPSATLDRYVSSRPVYGLASRKSKNVGFPPDRRLPVRCTVAIAGPNKTRLPLRGQRRHCLHATRRTDFPFHSARTAVLRNTLRRFQLQLRPHDTRDARRVTPSHAPAPSWPRSHAATNTSGARRPRPRRP